MNNRFKLLLITILAFSLASAACEGPTGSDGPQGPQGEQGEEGSEGPQGPQGETGTANVIYSEWIPIDWNSNDTVITKSMTIDEPRITESFLETGVILFFIRDSNGITASVPFSLNNTSYYFIASPENTLLQFLAVRLSGMSGDVYTSWIADVRYVLIPGGVPAKMGNNFLKDYKAVKEYYGIPD